MIGIMKLSQYTDSYLDATSNGRLVTPGTYIAYKVKGRAKRWAGRYTASLVRSVKLVGAVAVKSIGGGTAYVLAPELTNR